MVPPPNLEPRPGELRILHTNDAHGRLTPAAAAVLQTWRAQCDLYFDSGDAVKSGNLGVPLRPEPVWEVLAGLDCTASVLGNRESQLADFAFRAKIAGARHPLLAANMHHRDGSPVVERHLVIKAQGLRVGVVGVMVAMVTPKMKTQALSAFLWDPPIETALESAEALRPEVDVLIALSHIGYRQDVVLAETGAYDLILGGHSHTVLEAPVKVGRTWICQGGSHARFAGVYRFSAGQLAGGLVSLGP